MLREVGRLETSLKCAGEREKLVFLHYPPKYMSYQCPEILEMLERYGVERCYYGHIHGRGIASAFEGEAGQYGVPPGVRGRGGFPPGEGIGLKFSAIRP